MKRFLLVAGAALLLLALGAAAVVWEQYTALVAWAARPHAVPKKCVVEVPAGAGPRVVSDLLAAAGAVDDAVSFYRDVRYLRRVAGRLKTGEYLFDPAAAQSPDQIIDRLLKGEVIELKVTIPEGLRLEEQAQVVEEAGIGAAAEFVRLARDPAFLETIGTTYSLPLGAGGQRTMEGYLFPDTYLVPRKCGVPCALRLMAGRFAKAWAAANAQRLPAVSLSMREAVVLASIIEKETGQPDERPRISCVFHNRLAKGMKLQTDPTVIYDIIQRTGKFEGNLKRVDLDTPGPFNTYVIKGLPPGPIANPGEAALAAALHPADCRDMFFVSKNDGSHVFCPDLACHEANVQKWQVEFFRQRRGVR